MKITNTTTFNITFQVEAYWDEEGGMGHEEYGGEHSELSDALASLQSARNTRKENEWLITCKVVTVNK